MILRRVAHIISAFFYNKTVFIITTVEKSDIAWKWVRTRASHHHQHHHKQNNNFNEKKIFKEAVHLEKKRNSPHNMSMKIMHKFTDSLLQ